MIDPYAYDRDPEEEPEDDHECLLCIVAALQIPSYARKRTTATRTQRFLSPLASSFRFPLFLCA